MQRWMQAGGGALLAVLAGMLGWWIAHQRQQASAPTTAPVAAAMPAAPAASETGPAADLLALLPDLGSDNAARREAGQKALDEIPAERYEEVMTLVATQTNPEVRTRLVTRAGKMVEELLRQQTAASTQILIDVVTRKKDGFDRARAFTELANRMANSENQGGGEAAIQALTEVMPQVTNESTRVAVCMLADFDLTPGKTGKPLETGQVEQMTAMLRDRLKNDPSPEVRFWSACGLAECGDKTGVPEMEKDALAMKAAGNGIFSFGSYGANDLHWVDGLAPAMEKVAGQEFVITPAKDTDPDVMMHGEMMKQMIDRRAKLDLVVAWIKAHPTTAPAPP